MISEELKRLDFKESSFGGMDLKINSWLSVEYLAQETYIVCDVTSVHQMAMLIKMLSKNL